MRLHLRRKLRRVQRGLHHARFLSLLSDSTSRKLFREMWAFSNSLEQALSGPLLERLQHLTSPEPMQANASEETTRVLADTAAYFNRRSGLGICMRRTLLRVHFLRRTGVPVEACFGSRLGHQQQSDVTLAGHAWTILDNAVYFEPDDLWQDHTEMFRVPAPHPPGSIAQGLR